MQGLSLSGYLSIRRRPLEYKEASAFVRYGLHPTGMEVFLEGSLAVMTFEEGHGLAGGVAYLQRQYTLVGSIITISIGVSLDQGENNICILTFINSTIFPCAIAKDNDLSSPSRLRQ